MCIWFPSGEGLGVCDKRLLIHSEERCAALPLMKGGQGDVDSEGVQPHCASWVSNANVDADADANGTSPYPLHKGDL